MKLNRILNTILLPFRSVCSSVTSIFSIKFLSLFLFAVFFAYSLSFFYNSSKNLDAQTTTLPNCDALAASVDADPGVNCIYRNLPLCSGAGAPSSPVHRINCFDVVDLPLCDHIPSPNPPNRSPMKNCVRMCSDSYFANQGVTAVFNQNCVRFCDDMPSGMTPDVGASGNCIQRSCHQLPISVEPRSTGSNANCNMVRCDGLWPAEHERLYSSISYQWRYCSDTNLKCFNMPQDLLQYVNLTNANKICELHNCPPGPGTDICNLVDSSGNSCTIPSSTCSRPNEHNMVLAKPTAYRALYDQYVSDIQDASGNAYVSGDADYPGICVPLSLCTNADDIRRDYRICGPVTESDPLSRTIVDGNCDATGPGNDCQGSGTAQQQGFCFRTVNCTTNPSDPICPSATPVAATPPPTSLPVVDNFNSWFYRPTPSDKATRISSTTNTMRLRGMQGADGGFLRPGLCYGNDRHDWRAARDVTGRYYRRYNVFGITIEIYGFSLLEGFSISPGICGMGGGLGDRGTGYVYLKGTNGLLYNDVDNDAMYFEGAPVTNFNNDLATHSLNLCLRFKNTLCLQCQGRRECVPTMSNVIRGGESQICGRDICKTFVIPVDRVSSSYNPQSCLMRNGDGGMDGDCSSVIDTYLRMRAVYYDSMDAQGGVRGVVCGFLDAKGHLAYQPDTFGARRGNEHIGDNITCENDTDHEYPNCSGHDSADNPGLAHKWRTVLRAQYIGNNQPSGNGAGPDGADLSGYYDRDGNFFHSSECAPVSMRNGSGLIYNLANVVNSPTMFNPPMIVLRVNNVYGGTASSNITDFHRPEIFIQYGTTAITTFADGAAGPTSSCYNSTSATNCPRALPSSSSQYTGYNQTFLSLDAGEMTGRSADETNPGGAGTDSPAYARIYSEIPGVADRISTEVFLEKDYDYVSGYGTVCLYQKTSDANGNYSPNPLRIACFRRQKPTSQIYWSNASFASNQFGLRITAPSLTSSTVPNSSQVSIPSATTFANFNLLQHSVEYCSLDLENYRFCLSRGQCTQLARECSDAASARSAALIAGTGAMNYDGIIRSCNEDILPFCLRQRGLSENGSIFDVLRTNDYGAYRCRNSESAYLEGSGVTDANSTLPTCPAGVTPFLYGWFNNVEIVRGIENRLPYVIEHRIADGRKGICQIRATSNYLIDTTTVGSGSGARNVSNVNTNCLGGGDGVNCICVTVPSNYVVSDPAKYRVRLATPREIGISYDIPVRSVCPTYIGRVQNPATGDLFPMTNVGSTATGTCDLSNGWTNSLNARFQNQYPTMDCIDNPAVGANPYEGIWDTSSLTNACIRRSCNQLVAGVPDLQGNYLGIYDDGENGECKGAKHGFANWPIYSPPSGIQPEQFIAHADSCITGFKAFGATPNISTSTGLITGYSGGLPPRRLCANSGIYSNLTRESVDLGNSSCSTSRALTVDQTNLGAPQAGDPNPTSRSRGCVRIKCPAINPTVPTSVSDAAAWNAWFASGGATYPETNASRSDSIIRPESTASGSCNNSLGFFAVAGGGSPTRTCDHLGNWSAVSNPCSTLTCNAVSTDTEASNSNNGFAMWNAVTDAQMTAAVNSGGNAIQETATSCATGYVQNPYPPATNSIGNPLPNAVANDLTRSAEMPKRYCIGGVDPSGNLYKIWRVPTNSCINSCPGSAQDDRIGVGKTRHNYYNLTSAPNGLLVPRPTTITVDWPATLLGQDAYVSNWTGIPSNFNASHFLTGRGNRNNLYLLKRRCGANGRWEDPTPMCALNDGAFGSATFRGPGAFGYANSIRAYTDAEYANKMNITGFETATGVCAVPTTIPAADRTRVLSILNGLTLATPVVYCSIMSGNYIDQTFLVRTTATVNVTSPITSDCGTCPAVSGTVTVPSGGALNVNTESRNYYPSETVSGSRLSCAQHYAYRGPSSSGLSAICDANGTGSWSYQNANFCRASCQVNPSLLLSQDVGNSDVCGDGGVTYTMRASELSTSGSLYVKDGEIFEFVAYRSCRTANPIPGSQFTGSAARDACSYWRYSFMCNNGTMLVNHNTATSLGGCNYSRYDYTTTSWSPEYLYGISPNPYFVTYRHIQRTPTLSTGVGVLKDDDIITDFTVACTRNCSSAVATRGVSSTANLATSASTSTSGPSSSSWNTVSVSNSVYNSNTIGNTRTGPCGNTFSSTSTDAIFNLSSQASYNPGTVIDGTCPPNRILSGAVPQITCQSSGDWALTNGSNCVNITSTTNTIGAGTGVPILNLAGSTEATLTSGSITDSGATTSQTTVHARHFDLTSSNAIVIIDLYSIDNHFKISINGRNVHSLSCFEVQPEPISCPPDPTGGSEMTILAGGGVIGAPWVRNTNGLPRVRIITNGVTTQVLGTRSNTSTTMDVATVSAGSIVTPILTVGRNDVVLTVLDGQGPDSVDASITVRQF